METFEDKFEEVISKPSKSVSVGNHNVGDTSRKDLVQKGEQPWSLEIDS